MVNQETGGAFHHEIIKEWKPTLSELAWLLRDVNVLSNFASPAQFGGFVLAKPSEKSLTLLTAKQRTMIQQESMLLHEGSKLDVSRIFFAGELAAVEMQELLESTMHRPNTDLVVLNFLTPEQLLIHGRLFVDFGAIHISPYPELQCDLEMLLTVLRRQPSNLQARLLTEKAEKAIRSEPQLTYHPLKEVGSPGLDSIHEFLSEWQAQSGLDPALPLRLILRFYEDKDLQGGVICDPSEGNRVVALNIFQQHPASPAHVISTVDQTLRRLEKTEYKQLGVLSHLWQAQHISKTYPRAKKILIGGVGATINQQHFKRQFALAGELWSYAVIFDPNNRMGEMNYQQKARIAHHVWE